jgi:hypothetical protein
MTRKDMNAAMFLVMLVAILGALVTVIYWMIK